MSSGQDIFLEIVSPEEVIFTGMVEAVFLPGTQLPFEVLKDHSPMISSLAEGEITYVREGERTVVPINGGFVEICYNHVCVSVEI